MPPPVDLTRGPLPPGVEAKPIRRLEQRDKHGRCLWEFRCLRRGPGCKRTFICPAASVRSGNTRSCGCRVRQPDEQTYAGKKRDKLTARGFHRKRGKVQYDKSGRVLLLCDCACGGTKITSANTFTTGKVTSCGKCTPRLNSKRSAKPEYEAKKVLLLEWRPDPDGPPLTEPHYRIGWAAHKLGISIHTFYPSAAKSPDGGPKRPGWLVACPWLDGAGVPFQTACGAFNREDPYIPKSVIDKIIAARAATACTPIVIKGYTYKPTFLRRAAAELGRHERTIKQKLKAARVVTEKRPGKGKDGKFRRRAFVPNAAYAALGLTPPIGDAGANGGATMTPPTMATESCPKLPFVPTAMQQRFLDALEHRVLTADNLQKRLNIDRKSLYARCIHPLRTAGLIGNNRRLGGYFRYDTPPPKFAKFLAHHPKAETVETEMPAV